LAELVGSLAVTNESRRLGERRKATKGGCLDSFAAIKEEQQIEMFFDDVRDVRE